MAKISVILFQSKVLSDGTYPVMLRVSKGQGNRKYFSLGFSATTKQFDNENGYFIRDKRLNPSTYAEDEQGKRVEIEGYAVKNDFIDRKKIRAKEIIDEFDRNNTDWTFKMFEQKFINESKKVLVIDYLKQHIEKLKSEKHYGNATAYSRLLVLLECFQKDKKVKVDRLYFHDFDYSVVNKFYLYLKNDRGVKGNTVSYYFRTLRALMNNAIKDGCGSKEAYCFSNEYTDTKKVFHIGKLKETTRKRFIPKEYLSTLKNTVFEREPLEYSRRLFLLSFYLYGCSYVDLAKLKKSDIKKAITKDGKPIEIIEYNRSKTHKDYTIQIRPEIREQLDWFRDNYSTIGDYLLPCITKNLKDEELQNHIINRRNKYSKYLKEIAKELDFPEALSKISTYYSRHSYAMAMLNSGKSMEVIQQALGHEDLATTKIYLDSFDTDYLANESDGLI
ncbi:site-specific integrase [Parabacteroides sp. PF5-9]|uniref:site-specific integrase n=1 Tax=Parabacteroides sp. PF5-9 TaxID=1742404 RepID=UPI0024763093|nr:site-specific integrase [Parabacteroides sp. PF5-9]MDH6356950.1 site-specific recombinase XerD [Parabacteroides sp. PF5-9]